MTLSTTTIPKGPEFKRIRDLDRRYWKEEEVRKAVDLLTRRLAKPGGSQTLLPFQAQALVEGLNAGGLLAQARVGSGKTLLSFLLPVLLNSVRPLLIVPASLREKTEHELAFDYGINWKVVNNLKIISYNKLSQASSADFLTLYDPDLIICDEAHALKDRRSARTRRFLRWGKANPQCKFVFMTGSLTRKGLLDYSHLSALALGEGSPVPKGWELDMWSRATDASTDDWFRPRPGALSFFSDGETDIDSVREGYRKRLSDTSGVVTTLEKEHGIELKVINHSVPHDPDIESAVTDLRESETAPDGDIIETAVVRWGKIREMASGFYYVQDPPPPTEWREARTTWQSFVRDILKQEIIGIDSPLQVANKFPECSELARWREVRDTYDREKNRKAVWFSDTVVDLVCEWLEDNQGIVWVEHDAFGKKMEERGYRYFGGGKEASRDIRTARGPVVASIKAHGTGKNLQHYSKALCVSPPPSGGTTEQMLGRLVRHGQKSKVVQFDLLLHVEELFLGLLTSVTDARYIQTTTGSPQLLLGASMCSSIQNRIEA